MSVVERLDEEFVKVLKGCDAHSHEYVDRLKDEPKVMELLEITQKMVDKLGSPSEMCRVYLKRIEHIYFKFDSRVIQQKNVSEDTPSKKLHSLVIQNIYLTPSTYKILNFDNFNDEI